MKIYRVTKPVHQIATVLGEHLSEDRATERARNIVQALYGCESTGDCTVAIRKGLALGLGRQPSSTLVIQVLDIWNSLNN